MKQCEADIVNMSMMQRSSSGYEPPADKLYDQPLLGFVRTKNVHTEKQQDRLPQNIADAHLNLQNKCALELQNRCSLEDVAESEEDDSESCSSSDEDDSWQEADPKLGPEERKAARKANKKKVKEEKREARKTKKPKAEKKKRKKMAKAKCKR
jgi:RIO kinase 1